MRVRAPGATTPSRRSSRPRTCSSAVIYLAGEPGRHTVNEPKYERVASTIRAQITSGELRPGDQLPTTRQLIEQHGVSYGSVRTALLILKAEGLIEGRQGEGVFVRQR